MCVLILSTTFVLNISHSKKNWAKYGQKCMLVFMWRARYSRPILMKLVFSWQIFEKYISNSMKILPMEADLFHAERRTDGQTWQN